jgi:plasmid stabilization system protein ParE
LILTDGAVRGLERCRRFLAQKNRLAALRAAETIERHFSLLSRHPEIGRPYADAPELREVVIGFGDSGYVALYRREPAKDAIFILAFRQQKEAGYR